MIADMDARLDVVVIALEVALEVALVTAAVFVPQVLMDHPVTAVVQV